MVNRIGLGPMGAEIQRAARENEAYQRRTTISGVPAISKPDIRTGRFQSVKFILREPADIRYGSEQLTLFKTQSLALATCHHAVFSCNSAADYTLPIRVFLGSYLLHPKIEPE
jgi:hypothetical protein